MMKGLVALLVVIIAIAAVGMLAQLGAFGGAWFYHQRGLYDDEINWLETFKPVMPWERGIERLIARRERERVERALYADRIDRAVHLFRAARSRARAVGIPM